jgi:hypothetical protein
LQKNRAPAFLSSLSFFCNRPDTIQKYELPDFSCYNTPNWEKCAQMATKYPKWQQNRPNGDKIYQHLSFIARHSKIYPNWDFWFENVPSGIPVQKQKCLRKLLPKNAATGVADTARAQTGRLGVWLLNCNARWLFLLAKYQFFSAAYTFCIFVEQRPLCGGGGAGWTGVTGGTMATDFVVHSLCRLICSACNHKFDAR